MRRLAWASLLTTVLLCVGASLAAAATDLVASEPRAHQEFSQRPSAVTLAFDRKLDGGDAKLLVVDSAGANHTINELIVEGTNVTALLSYDLPRGTYTVYYRVVLADGEPEGGAFQFSYGPGHWTSVKKSWSGADSEPAILRDTDPKGNPLQPSSGTEPPEAEVSTSASAIPVTGTPTASSGSPAASASSPVVPGAAAGSEGGNGALWAGVGVVVLAAVGGAGYLVFRARRQG